MNNIKKKIIYTVAVALVVFVGAFSCSEYDDHYKVSEEVKGRLSLWELISQQPELSTFAELLKQVSYDQILSSEQSYTVWAPQNEALASIDRNDTEAVLRLVSNHIARYVSPSALTENGERTLYMTSSKKMLFSKTGNTYSIGGSELSRKDLAAKNGILHTLKKQLTYEPSVWQYMETAGYDSIRSYLYAFDKMEFSSSASTIINTNEEGMYVYDSVFVHRNDLWYVYEGAKGIGFLNNEDSLYTMIMPDNKAWKEAYDRTYEYFRPDQTVENPDSVQAANTRYSIVQDLVFRGSINPDSYGVNDTLFTTRWAPIIDPSHLFTGLVRTPVSNGVVYPTSLLNYRLNESCIKPIQIEAENAWGRWHNSNSDAGNIYTYWDFNIADISDNGYLYVYPSSPSSAPSVSFELPDVLAAEYDIYCVYLAQSYVEELAPEAIRYVTRLRFDLQQWDKVGKKEESSSWKTIQTWEDQSTPKYVTQPEGISKILVTEKFRFPFANFNETESVFRLKVTARPARNDPSNQFKNEMRIDYILLEPSL